MNSATLRMFLACTISIATAVSPRLSFAGRAGPEHLFAQFEQGYGIVAVRLAKLTPVPDGEEPSRTYDFVFNVVDVVAQPIVGQPFPLHARDSVTFRFFIGYASEVESLPEAGQTFYLTVKREKDGSYVHARGASAVNLAEKLTKEEAEVYARVRELAAVPEAARVDGCVTIVKDLKESDELRRLVLYPIATGIAPESRLDEASKKRVLAAIRGIWNDPTYRCSYWLAYGIDAILSRRVTAFESSVERYDGWFRQLFSPTPENLKDDNDRDNFAYQHLDRMAQLKPRLVAERMLVEIPNAKWPMRFRRVIAGVLLRRYLFADEPDSEWEPALRKFYLEALKAGEPIAVRLVTWDLARAINGEEGDGRRRGFVLDPDVRRPFRAALLRMKERLSRNEDDINAKCAMIDIEKLLATNESPTTGRTK